MKRFLYAILISFLFTNIVFASSDTAETLYAKAYGNIYKNNQREAIRIFEKAIKTYPDCAYLYAGLGDVYLKQNNLNKAIEMYEKAQQMKYSRDIYKIDFYYANLLKTYQDINKAMKELFKATNHNNSTDIIKNIKFILEEEYSKTFFITEWYLNTNDTSLNYANSIKNNGKLELALKEYLKILSENPQNFHAANNAALTLLELKDYNLAEKYIKMALELNPNSALILNNLAVINSYQNKYTDMHTNFEKAMKIKQHYLPLQINIPVAQIHKNLNLYTSQTVDTILDIIKKDNENYYAIITLAQIYLLKEDYQSAKNILETINPEYNYKISYLKALTSYKNNDLKTALEYINKADNLFQNQAKDYLLKAKIYTSMQNYEFANSNFKYAIETKENIPNLYYYQAIYEQSIGNKNKSNSLLKEFVKQNNGNTNIDYWNVLLR